MSADVPNVRVRELGSTRAWRVARGRADTAPRAPAAPEHRPRKPAADWVEALPLRYRCRESPILTRRSRSRRRSSHSLGGCEWCRCCTEYAWWPWRRTGGSKIGGAVRPPVC